MRDVGTVVRALGLAVGVAGCATASSPAFKRAGEPEVIAAALARAQDAPGGIGNVTGKPIVVLAATGPRGPLVLAVHMAGGTVLWRADDEVSARIAIARSAVVYARKDGALIGRGVATGQLLWDKALPRSERRLGYAIEGDVVYDAVHPVGRPRQVTLSSYDAASGERRWTVELEGEAGAPAARGGLVALPRRSQYVSLIDGGSGTVLADILSREETASFVRALPEGLFFGSRGIYLAARETAMGVRAKGTYLRAKLPAFVRSTYHVDMYQPEQADYTALDRNRILWRVSTAGGAAAFADGLIVVHNFRFFFGLDAESGRLRWAYTHPRVDIVSSERTGGAVLFVTTDGELGAVDVKGGRRIWQGRVAEQGPLLVRGATFDAEGFTPAGEGKRAEPLARTLSAVLWDPDRRFVDVKVYAVNELARLEGREVTQELLRALEASELPPAAIDRATEALVERKDPASLELYSQALGARSNYAEDKRPARLDVLARAIATTKARQVVPALVEHLRAPQTDPTVVRDIADAALATEARESVGAFSDYLMQYRADPGFAKAPGPLLAAAEVLVKLGGLSKRSLLLFVAQEARTLPPLRAWIERALFVVE